MTRKKVLSLSIVFILILNLFIIIPVVAFNNRNTDMIMSLDVINDKRYYKAGDTVSLELNIENYNENSQGIAGFQYDLYFSEQLFENISIDKSVAKINQGDTYEVVSKANNYFTGMYVSSISSPVSLSDLNTETDDKGSYYVLPKNNRTLAEITMNVKSDVTTQVLQQSLVNENSSIVLSSRDDSIKLNNTFKVGKINIINTTPSVILNGVEYKEISDLGVFDEDITVSSNRQDDTIQIYKDDIEIENTTLTENGNYKVIVTDVTQTTLTVSFTIRKIELTSISINTNPNKVNYFVGDKLDLTNLTIVENYSDGTKSEPINVTEEMVSITDLQTQGNQEITITHKGLTTSFFVTVDEKIQATLQSIDVESNVDCVYETQILTNKDFTVTANYSDGTSVTVYGFEIDEAYKTAKVGEDAVVTISYEGKTKQIILPVKARTVQSIEIEKLPNKTEYIEKENQELDLTGGLIRVNYNVGNSDILDMTDENISISGFNPTTIGQQNITVSYNGVTTSFELVVNQKQLVSISVTNPKKTQYYVTEKVDFTGMVVTATYDNGETKQVNDYTIGEYDTTTSGEKEIIISYNSKIATIKVIYKDLEISKIELVGTPKTDYIEGNELDIENLSLNVYYKEVNTIDIVDVSIGMVTVPDMSTTGQKTVVITYNGFTVEYDITVKAKTLVDVSFEGELSKTEYLQGQEFDITGVTVNAIYDNNTKENVTDKATISFDKNIVSNNAVVTISYDKYSKQYTVAVLSRENVDLFNQAVYTVMNKEIIQDRTFYQEILTAKSDIESKIAGMSSLELQEIKATYDEFKVYLLNVQNTILPAVDNISLGSNLSASVEAGNMFYDEDLKSYEIKISVEQTKLINNLYKDAKVETHFKSIVEQNQSAKNTRLANQAQLSTVTDAKATFRYTTNDSSMSVVQLVNDTVTTVNHTYENGEIVFTSDANGEYMILSTANNNTVVQDTTNTTIDNAQNNAVNNETVGNQNTQQTNQDISISQTGDYLNIVVLVIVVVIIMVIAVLAVVLLIVLKKKNNHKK